MLAATCSYIACCMQVQLDVRSLKIKAQLSKTARGSEAYYMQLVKALLYHW